MRRVPVSSVDTTGMRTVRSPAPTLRVASRRSVIGPETASANTRPSHIEMAALTANATTPAWPIVSSLASPV